MFLWDVLETLVVIEDELRVGDIVGILVLAGLLLFRHHGDLCLQH
jgi:hypothetical protein